MIRRKPFNPPPPPVRKKGGIIAFQSFYWIHSSAVYRISTLDPDGIEGDHPADIKDATLGALAREALQASRFISPDHPDWDRVDEFLKQDDGLEERWKARAGVRSLKALYRGSGDLSLTLKDGVISLIPHKYVGHGGFDPIDGVKPVELPETISDAELGIAIRDAIAVSRAAAAGG